MDINEKYRPTLNCCIKPGDELYFINKFNTIDSVKVKRTLFQREDEIINGLYEVKETFVITTESGKEINFDNIEQNEYFLNKEELINHIINQK